MTARAQLDRACKRKVEHSVLVEELKDSGASSSGSISSGICGEGAGSVTSV